MGTRTTTSSGLVDHVHAGAEAPWERPLAGPHGWQPVADDSVVWGG